MIQFACALVQLFSPRPMKAHSLYVVVQMNQKIPHALHPLNWRGDSKISWKTRKWERRTNGLLLPICHMLSTALKTSNKTIDKWPQHDNFNLKNPDTSINNLAVLLQVGSLKVCSAWR